MAIFYCRMTCNFSIAYREPNRQRAKMCYEMCSVHLSLRAIAPDDKMTGAGVAVDSFAVMRMLIPSLHLIT
jgi:hypothetical protein